MSKKPVVYRGEFLRTESHQKRLLNMAGVEREGERLMKRANLIEPTFNVKDHGPHYELQVTGGTRE